MGKPRQPCHIPALLVRQTTTACIDTLPQPILSWLLGQGIGCADRRGYAILHQVLRTTTQPRTRTILRTKHPANRQLSRHERVCQLLRQEPTTEVIRTIPTLQRLLHG